MRRHITAAAGAAAIIAAVVLVAGQEPGTVSLPVLTCSAIIDMAETDGVLDGEPDFDACVTESESQPPEIQLEIARAIFGEARS